MKKNKPELLMPAGNFEKLVTAFRFGADACYMGEPNFSLRYRENQTDNISLEKSIKYAHKINKKIYITINLYPHNEKISSIIKHIKLLRKLKPDAIIFSDPGVYNLIKKYYPEAVLHLSVQATATNYETIKFWQKLGIKRIILARELSLDEISEIHEKVPDIELETFVHGAICMAYSGRCLLSNYLTGRDANQGDCAHVCRWNYKVLEENLRPGEYMPIYENQHGTHILSSRDLCLIEHLKELKNAGICSFKVEGRAKNVSYVATIAKAYKQAINDIYKDQLFNKNLLKEVKTVSNRGFFTGFYFGKPQKFDQQLDANRTEGTYDFVGIVKTYNQIKKLAEIQVKGKITVGDTIEIITPNSISKIKITKIFTHSFKSVNCYNPGLKEHAYIKIDQKIEAGDILRKKIK